MRDPHSVHHLPQGPTDQLDLFARPNDSSTARMPQWRTLPAETRQALTKLMARLLGEHEHDRLPGPTGGRSDV